MRFLNIVGALTGLAYGVARSNVPIFMYVDVWDQSPDDISAEFIRMADAGVSHIIMAFELEGNALFPDHLADTVAIWNNLSDGERQTIASELHKRGTKLLISSGGASEGTYWQTQDASAYGSRLCQLAKSLSVDGVDFDKEGFGWVSKEILDWNLQATTACRQVWPEAIITSAPQSPHVSSNAQYNWADGLTLGAPHDYYLIQYYNQGTWTQDTTYQGLFSGSGVGAINELRTKYGAAATADQFVVGKPYLPSHAGSGYVELSALREMMCKAWTEQGYRGGLMFWKHPWGEDLTSLSMLAEPCDSSADDDSTSAPVVDSTTVTPVVQPTTVTPVVQPTTVAPTTTSTYPVIPSSTTRAPRTPPTTTTRTTKSTLPVIPTHPTQSTPSQAGGDPISDCVARITAKPEYIHFESTCKEFCSQYAETGPLAPYCPKSASGDDLINCVTSQQPYCISA